MLMALFVGLLLLLVRDHEMTGVLVGHPHAHESQNKQHLPFPLSSQFLNDYPVFTVQVVTDELRRLELDFN